MTQGDYIRLKAKLAVAKDIAEDFHVNMGIETIISTYEARIKEYEKIWMRE